MITWFKSLQGTITLSVIAMLSFIAYAFLEAFFFLGQWNPSIIAAMVEMLVIIAVIGSWVWGIIAAAGGSRGGLIAMLIFSALPTIFTLYDLLFYSPIPYGWPLLQIVVIITFTTCLLAIGVVAYQIWG